METIESISEAFSMQPATLSINEDCIKEIKEEVIQVGENERISFYVGYDFEGKKKFQYLVKSVNVHFV